METTAASHKARAQAHQTLTPTTGKPAEESVPRGARLELRELTHSFGDLEVLADVDLVVEPGERLALVGPSGCGKSTLLELAAGLAEPTGGAVAVDGDEAATGRLERTVYMPQQDMLLPWLRAIDNAALALRLAGQSRSEARAAATPLFRRLGLAGFERSRPAEMSGGMRQRVAFARTLLSGRPALLLDEPFAALDAITRADLQTWLRGVLADEPRTVVLVTHDVEEALLLGDRVAVLSPRPGRVVLELHSPAPSPDAGVATEDRAAIVTDPAFVAARDRALHALGGGAS